MYYFIDIVCSIAEIIFLIFLAAASLTGGNESFRWPC